MPLLFWSCASPPPQSIDVFQSLFFWGWDSSFSATFTGVAVLHNCSIYKTVTFCSHRKTRPLVHTIVSSRRRLATQANATTHMSFCSSFYILANECDVFHFQCQPPTCFHFVHSLYTICLFIHKLYIICLQSQAIKCKNLRNFVKIYFRGYCQSFHAKKGIAR